MKTLRIILALGLLSTLWTVAAPVEAQGKDYVMGDRFDGIFRLGFVGKIKLQKDFIGEVDAAATVGITLRFEHPVHEFFTIGAQFSFYSPKADLRGADREVALDLGPTLKGRYPFRIKRNHIEVYAIMPLGFSLGTSSGVGDDFGPGWHIGVIPGVQVFVNDRIGVLWEMGWTRTDLRFKPGNLKGSLVLQQAIMNLGVVVAL